MHSPFSHPYQVHYTWVERLHFFIFRRWPDRVVARRLAVSDANSQYARAAWRYED